MALGTVRLHPGMNQQALVAAINQNFAMIENINRTQIFKDDTGTPRIIIGRFPNGEYGIIMSKPGKNVLEYEDFS